MPSKAVDIPRNRVTEPFQYAAPKLVMEAPSMQPWTISPPSLSPLHMSPPNMELPNFSPIQDHMPLPTLSASTFTPPQSFLTLQHSEPISVIKFSRFDPTVLAVGSSFDDPDDAQPKREECSITIYRVEDVEREVRGDDKMIARGVYDVRKKLRPRLHEMTAVKSPGAVLDLAFSPHEPELLVATLATGQLIAYRVRRGRYKIKQISTHTIAPETPLYSIVFSPGEKTLAAVTAANGQVYLVQLSGFPSENDSIKPVQTIQAHSSRVLRAAFSADGKALYTGGEDGSLSEWSVKHLDKIKHKWGDGSAHESGITAILPWPAPFASDIGKKRRLLLTGDYDGKLKVLDMSSHVRPPYRRQELELHGVIWRLTPLPALPTYEEVKSLGAGSFCAATNPKVELDPELQGVLAAAGRGGGRVLIHKQKFEDVFLPKRDGSDIVDWTTSDGVKMDYEGREKEYYWYDLADIEEHGDSPVYAGDATAVIDYDPLFKDAGQQKLRRGWRLATASRDGTMCFWQVYVE
ncbi:WD40-repeat-containing domain protein [Sphaerosporella brunnea]|uniref:methylated diphthine methylhydrolase n=1 Tax=Sphaerosporella brunnea TaxID=1250544 RepID=A0A5J5EHL8_9PEZI|nr:WD40-repeat-containing domain protein [Sphaerosporella brunnea]